MIYSLTAKNDSLLRDFYTKAIKELGDFYELNWTYNKPNIFILNTKEDVKKCRKDMGLAEFKTASGWVGSGSVYVVSKEIYDELMHPINLDEQYLMLIKHELSHLFFQRVSNFKSKPDWLWEGCAVYLSGQLKYNVRPEKFSDFLSFFEKHVGGNVYKESGFVIELLIKKFGEAKLLKLIKSLKDFRTESDFNELFKSIYNIELGYLVINDLWLSSNIYTH